MFAKNVIDLLQKVQSKIPVEKRPFKVPIHYLMKCWYFIAPKASAEGACILSKMGYY